jgi:SAM-dependent methyltransferase
MTSDSLSSVRDGYDRWAAVYDHDANPLQGLEGPVVRAAVHDAVGHVRGLKVLDLGAAVTAVDFSAGMLAQARNKPGADSIQFIVHDLHDPLPLPDGHFDLVVSGLVLEHLRDLDGFFAEAGRVLRPGGRAVISAMHPAMCLRGAMARFTDPTTDEIVQPGSLPHSISAFVMAALRAGFSLCDVAEVAPDAEFASRYPRAEKYVGWPMLVVMSLTSTAAG